MFYLKANRYYPEGSSHQEVNINLSEGKKVQDENDEKEDSQRKVRLPSEVDINVVHKYSHLIEKLLRQTYDALGIKLTGKLQVCDGCSR